MMTEKQSILEKINISVLNTEKKVSLDIINQSGKSGERLLINSSFDGYSDVIYEVKTLATVIETLSLASNVSDYENLSMISTISRIIQKILPDMDFIDDLIFEDKNSKNPNFKSLKEII